MPCFTPRGAAAALGARRSLRAMIGVLLVALVAAVVAANASAAGASAPRPCSLLTKRVAAGLLHGQPRAEVNTAQICSYARASERPAVARTQMDLMVVRQPSIGAAERVQRKSEKLAPGRGPAGVSFARERLRISGASASFYYMHARGKFTSGFAFAQAGPLTVQFHFETPSKGRPAFTVGELRTALTGVFTKLARQAD